MLQPNCSEAIFRIDLSNLTSKERRKVNKVYREFLFGRGTEELKWWGETSIYKDTIFGIPALIIQGEAPYHCENELRSFLEEKLGKEIWGKVKKEKREV